MAASDFLSKLPSIEELLENPRVTAAVERWNQSAAATQVRGAVSRLGSELARRAEDLSALGAPELLDRLVRQIDRPVAPPAGAIVNATGRFDAGIGLAPPMSAAALDAAQAVGVGFRAIAGGPAAETAGRLVGADAATVFSSPVQALEVTLEALGVGGVCLIARGEMGELAPGVRLDAVCRRAGIELCEVGATDTASVDDFREVLRAASADERSLVVLRRQTDRYQVVGAAPRIATAELVGVAHEFGAVLVEDLASVRPREDTPRYGDRDTQSVEGVLAEGADVVLFHGAGLVGGPLSGLAVGKRSVVDTIIASSAAAADVVEPSVDAALAATLALFERPDTLRFNHALYELLDAPMENLRSRAERLAPQIASVDAVAGAAVVDAESSVAIRVTPTDGDPGRLVDALRNAEPAVLATADGDAVVLDLRAVFPRQDGALVAAFAAG